MARLVSFIFFLIITITLSFIYSVADLRLAAVGAVLLVLALVARTNSKIIFALIGVALGLMLAPRMETAMLGLDSNIDTGHDNRRRYLGTVIEKGQHAFVIKTTQLAQNGALTPHRKTIHVSFSPEAESRASDIQVGQPLAVYVRLKQPKRQRVPGGFDEKLQMLFKGVDATGRLVTFEKINSKRETTFFERSLDRINRVSHSAGRGVLAAMLLGDKSGLEANTKSTFRRGGVYHLLVVSGLHLGLIASFIFVVFRFIASMSAPLLLLVSRQKIVLLLTVLVCSVYAWMIGAQLPVVRAFYVLVVGAVAVWLNRPLRPVYLLLVVGGGMLIWQPFWLFSASYQLTFATTVGIVLVIERWQRLEFKSQHGIFRTIILTALISVVAFLSSLPFIAYYFNEVSLVGPLTNVVIAPVLGWFVLPTGFFGLLLSEVSTHLGAAVLTLAALVIEVCIDILSFINSLPFASVKLASPQLWTMFVFGMSWLGLISMSGNRRWRVVLFLVATTLLVALPSTPTNKVGTLVDVGDGLAILLHGDDRQGETKHLLIDTGSKWTCQSRLLPTLRHYGVKQLAAVFISHWDEDHAGCLVELGKQVPIENLYASYRLPQDRKTNVVQPGQTFSFGRLQLEAVHAPVSLDDSDNNRSLVLLMTWKSGNGKVTRAVFPGDIERHAEQKLLANQPDLQPVDIMVAPHHGSFTSSTPAWVQTFAAKRVLFGREREPADEVLQRYRNQGAELWLTRQLGSIHLFSSNAGVELAGQACLLSGAPKSGWGRCP